MTDQPARAPGSGSSGFDDCWNRIGVHGDGSCPELERYVHCRNCPVYSAAALALLDGEPPANYSADWTSHFARPKPADERDTQSALFFRIDEEWFALPTTVVTEVADLRPIHSLPHRRTGIVLGLANVRGELLVCVSLGRVLGLEQSDQRNRQTGRTAQKRLLVIRREDVRTVCPADEVHGVHRFHPEELKQVPATVAKGTATYSKAVVSWGEHSVGLLDDQLLFHTLKRGLA